MTSVSEILDKMAQSLGALRTAMESEQRLLSAGSVSGSSLQRATEEKSAQLATLAWLEQQRQPAWHDADDATRARWRDIAVEVQALSEMNQHSGWLLEGQMAYNQQALAVLRPHQEAGLYGKDGMTAGSGRGGIKFSV
ncbi:flagellar export chaperone FlgN [uncultured Pluralibacter sp.]|uniref:flagellar export chaperone FlgN n=1 Tax=uncultured Pluralibacter sp. TaxID=1490864 RepID=UPI00260FE126|nr:flagellar export chaperone FlgN [uncultured Pluralibacter sp.]